ncbi:MAG: terminase family protein, partial [Candidatus Nezhaarchaeales archaeon]
MQSDVAVRLRQLILGNIPKACKLLFGIEPTSYQLEFISKVLRREGTGKYILVASTRAGKTTATSMLSVLLAIAYPDEDVVVVAPTMRQSNILFGMVRNYFYSNKFLLSLVDKRKGFTREIIHLINGSTLRMLTAGSPEGLLGFGASALIVDETASIDDAILKTRLFRMLASPRNKEKPLIVLLGTPHRAGFFYDAWLSDDYAKFRWTWRDAVEAGLMKPEMVEYFRKTLSKAEFARWFEAEFIPEEEGLFFNPVQLRECAVAGIGKTETPPSLRIGYRIYCGLDVARYGDDETALVCIKCPDGFREGYEKLTVVGYWR